MKCPNFYQEKKLRKIGYKNIIGLDEAGRGPLAGPVVASAVIINLKLITHNLQLENQKFLREIKDSKQLSIKKREELYKVLINHPNIKWGIGKVSEKVIDKINILEATKLAMKRAINNLDKKRRRRSDLRHSKSPIDFLILDGNFKLDLPISQKSIIKADEKVMSCAMASIIAKVFRDGMMKRYDKKYPQYNFAQHKGYGTKEHFKMIKKYGPCKIHRKSFNPMKNLII